MLQTIFFSFFIIMLIIRCYEVARYKIKLSTKDILLLIAGVLVSIAFLLEKVFKLDF